MNETLTLMKQMLTAFFDEKNMEKVLACFAPEACCFGIGEDCAEGTAALERLLCQMEAMCIPQAGYRIDTEKSCGKNGMITVTLQRGGRTVRYRLGGTLDGGRLGMLQFSRVADGAGRDLTATITRERVQERLLNMTPARGVMGGYCEPGFPLYTVDEKMLEYLGYADEQDFARDIGGLVDNCFHPDDRARVNAEVESQLQNGDGYECEYRIRHKNGSYRWVHDIGKTIQAEDGRTAILSVCYDVTKDKEHARMVESIVNGMQGGVALYLVEDDSMRLKPVYVSEGVGALSGRTSEEYLAECEEDASQATYGEDLGKVHSAIVKAVTQDAVTAVTYRIPHKEGGYVWLNATFSKYGERDGQPVLQAVFTPPTLQYELQTRALEQSLVGITVVDETTDEVYYANAAAFAMHGTEMTDYAGKSCHELFKTKLERCAWCRALRADKTKRTIDTELPIGEKIIAVRAERHHWKGKQVIVQYLSDVTEERVLQRRTERANREMTAYLQNIGNGVSVYSVTPQGKQVMRRLNDSLCDLYEGTREEIAKAYAVDAMFWVEAPDRERVQAFYDSRKPGTCTYHTHTLKGSEKWITLEVRYAADPELGTMVYTTYHDVTELMEAQEQLRLDEKLTEDTCNFANVWMFRYDMAKKCAYPDKNLRSRYGLPAAMADFPEGLFERPLVRPRYEDACREMMRRVDAGENDVAVDVQVNDAAGGMHWLRFTWRQMPSEAGELRQATGYAMYIDAEKRLESRMRLEREKMLSAGPNLVSYAVVDMQKARVVEYKSLRPGETHSGVGRTLQEEIAAVLPFLPDEKDRRAFQKFHDTKDILLAYSQGITGRQMEVRRLCADNRIRWERNIQSLLLDPDTGEIYLYDYYYDIHTQKIMQEVTQAAVDYDYERLGSVNMLNGQITVVYPQYENKNIRIEIKDYAEMSRGYATRIYPDDRESFLHDITLENVAAALENSEAYEFSHRVLGTDGKMRYKKTRFCYYDRERKIGLMTRSDITTLIAGEEQQKQTLKNALLAAQAATQAKTEFLSRMSHEIRTPMNAIMGMTAIAQQSPADTAQTADCLEKIDLSSRYLLTLINDILEMSRIESGRTEIAHAPFEFALLLAGIRTVSEPLARQADLRMDFINKCGPDADTRYYGDRMRIQQVLVNIIGNAVKFTKPGGRIRFTTGIRQKTEKQAVLTFAVEDTGIGMSEGFMQHMFEPFVQEDATTTSKYGGSGLGLAISKSLATEMGGDIEVESYLGIGSTFTVWLPLDRVDAAVPAAEKSTAPALNIDLRGRRVLMAEDHPLNVMVAQKLLEARGVLVDVAENGRKAVEMFEKADPCTYDAILMDIRMPVMDGLTAARVIRAMPRPDAAAIPIIAMTANALAEDRRNSCAAGMNAHLAKPFDPAQLYGVLAQQISKE